MVGMDLGVCVEVLIRSVRLVGMDLGGVGRID